MLSFTKTYGHNGKSIIPYLKKLFLISYGKDFLNRRVITNEENINLVDYAHMTQTDLTLLKDYLKSMAQINIDNYNRAEQLAYWINVYNALTVQTVANYYPISNIQEINISPGLFSVGPWGANLITLKDTALSLR